MGDIADLLRQREQQDREYNLQVSNEQQYDPDRADRVLAVSAKTKLPPELVDTDLDNLESLLKKQAFNLDNYRDAKNGAPAFNRFAAENPYHLAVLERDQKNMTRLERSLSAIGTAWDSGWAMSEVVEIQERREQGVEFPDDIERLKTLRSLIGAQQDDFGAPKALSLPARAFQKALVFTAQQIPVYAWMAGEAAEKSAAGMVTGATVGGMYGSAGGTFAAPGLGTVVGGTGGAAGGGVLGATIGFTGGMYDAGRRLEEYLAFDEYQSLGIPEDEARAVSKVVGIVAGSMEAFGLGAMTKKLPGFRNLQRDVFNDWASRVFEDQSFKASTARLIANYGEVMATEIITETGQESMTIAGQEYLKSRQRAKGDTRPEMQPMTSAEYWETMRTVWIQTLAATSILGGMGPATQFYRESRQAYRAERALEYWRTIGETAKNSKTREKAPNVYEEFVDRLTQDGRYDNIRVDANELITYFQEQGADPDEVAKNLGLDEEQFNEAQTLGQDVEIPVESYLKKIAATEHHENLAPHLKVGDQEFSYAEAQLWKKNNPELVAELERRMGQDEELTDAKTEVEQDVAGQLVAAGHEASTAQKLAKLWGGIVTMAQRAGKEPMEFYRQKVKGVKSVKAVDLEKKDVDVAVDPLLDRLRSGEWPKAKAVRGVTLMDFLKKHGGVLDQGGELSARDAQLEFPGLVSKRGMELDKAAELAAEAGYLPAHDVGLLMDAIDRELAGKAGPGLGADPEAVALQQDLEQLADIIDEAGLDIAEMSNAEIRAALDKFETYMQESKLDAMTLQELSEVLEGLTKPGTQTGDLVLLGQVMPHLMIDQDFGDLTFTDTMRLAGSEQDMEVTRDAQALFEQSKQRKKALKMLKDCLSG